KYKNNYKYVIAVSSFILMAVAFSIVNSVNTILTAPVIEARNFSIGEYSLVFTITAITVAIFSPLVGSLLNRINIKIIMSLSSILAGGGYILYGFANNILSFYIIGIVVAIGMCGLTTIPISTMISDWFEPEKKGSIMGIVFAGIGTGSFFWMQIVSKFLERYNYRLAYLFLGAIVIIVSLPISLFIAKRPADVVSKLKEQNNKLDNKSNENSYKFNDISRIPSFWTFSIGLLLMGISFAGIKQHVQPYLSVLGYSISFNANIGSTLAVTGLFANIVGGILFDKLKTKIVLYFMGGISCISIVFLILAGNPLFAYLFTIFYGLTMCMSSIWPSYGVSRLFSNKNYSVIFGFVNMFFTIGTSVGPFLSGVITDTSFGYKASWVIYFFTTIIAYFLFIKSIKNN
ncbi:MAG: MFS transporter, partial [Romboutsia sp.]|nr:MFS transporter [Romboutsia sp.]